MRKKRRYMYVTEEQIRQAVMELEREENMELEQEIEEANAWAEENHIVRPPFPVPINAPQPFTLKLRRDAEAKPKKRNRFKPCIQLVAVFLIVLLGGWYTQSDTVQGMRLDLVNLFTATERDRGVLELDVQSEWNSFYRPSYLPLGLQLISNFESKSSTVYTQAYKSNTGDWINIIQSTEYIAYNYQNDDYSTIVIRDNYSAHLLMQNDFWYITWYDENNIFVVVNGNTSLQEGLNFINSVKWS